MADIEIVYRVPYCDYGENKICEQCFTEYASDLSCRSFYGGVKEETIVDGRKVLKIPFGDCDRAKFKYIHKGWTGKRYEMEEVHDQYNPHLDYMDVRLGNQFYDCVKVTLNGKCIFNEYDDDESKEEA